MNEVQKKLLVHGDVIIVGYLDFPRLIGHQLKPLLSGSHSFSRILPGSHNQGLNVV